MPNLEARAFSQVSSSFNLQPSILNHVIYPFLKRLLDILISGTALIILAPLFLPIMVLLRLTGEGEIFYLQERVGYLGKNFKLIKFATMLKRSPSIGTGTVTTKNDPRVLPAGRFLRKTKINELPQIFNVLLRDISIVGPRPLTTETFSFYSNDIQKFILRNRPGLTGIGSVVFRDEESELHGTASTHEYVRNVVAPYKGALEVWYDRRKSLWVDLRIIMLTAIAICWPGNTLHFAWFPDLPRRETSKPCATPHQELRQPA